MTIRGPYTYTGNGYCAAWMGFICSLVGVGMTLAHTRAALSSGSATQLGHATCALLLLMVLVPIVASDDGSYRQSRPQAIYTLVVACASLLQLLISASLQSQRDGPGESLARVVALARVLSWAVLASWCTFTGPFQRTGNGFFAAWGGALSSVLLLLRLLFPSTASAAPVAASPAADGDGEPTVPPLTAHPIASAVMPSQEAAAEEVASSAATHADVVIDSEPTWG